MPVLMVFVDGLGLGEPGPSNPLWCAHTPVLDRLCGQRPVWPLSTQDNARALDACLGVPGLPQSATGQTTLLTGINAARLEGGHVSAYPTARLKELLTRAGLPARLAARGYRVAFINAFRSVSLERIRQGTYAATATTCAMLGAQVPLRGVTQLASGDAVYHDLTGETLRRHGEEVELVSPQQAGRRAGSIALAHDFSLFEYFLTDVAGHRRDKAMAVSCLEALDSFLAGAMETLDGRVTLVLTSDHGNVEDLSTGSHTVNPVPLVWTGPSQDTSPGPLSSIMHVGPLILWWLGVRPDEH
ncbi:MAG: metalloenzyme [Bacillota bacterium]